MATLTALTIDDLEQELDQADTVEDYEAIRELLLSLVSFVEAERRGELEELEVQWLVGGPRVLNEPENELFGDVFAFILGALEDEGNVLVPLDEPYELTGRLSGLELAALPTDTNGIIWRSVRYGITIVSDED